MTPADLSRLAADLAVWCEAAEAEGRPVQAVEMSEWIATIERVRRDGAKASDASPPADEQALRMMMLDPRYWRSREPEFVKLVTEGFRRLVKQEMSA